MLQVEAIEGGYGKKKVLHGISLSVGAGEVVSMLGRNGMGKTTTLKTIMGLNAPTAGRIVLDGTDIAGAAPERVSRLGIGYVPEGRGIFPTLSVIENLTMAARTGPWTLKRVLELFPRLGQRRAHGGGNLSGGEQQMLSIGRALMLNPRMIMLDEATEGLAPLVQEEIWRCLAEIRRDKLSVLVVDKDLEALIELSDRVYVLEKGEVRWAGTIADVAADRAKVEQLIGLDEEVAAAAAAPSPVAANVGATVDTVSSMRDHEARIDRSVAPARIDFAPVFNTSVPFVDHHVAEGRGDKVMARWRDRSLTYAALADGVIRTAAMLRSLGIEPGDRVALFVKDTEAFYLGFLGAVRIGAVAIPINTFLRAADYAYMLKDSAAKAVLASDGTFEEVEAALSAEGVVAHHRIACDGPRAGWSHLPELMAAASPAMGAPHPTTPSDPCFWLYSSGSTGSPKASVHEHKDMLLTVEHFGVATLGITSEDVIFSAPKLFFAYGLGNALSFPLHLGATQILLEDRPTAENTLDMITQFKPTVYWGVPTLYAAQLAALAKGHKADFSSIRMCMSGGEPLPPAVLEGWEKATGVPILDGIGSSEVLHIYCSNRLDRIKSGSCGLPVPGYQLRVVGADGQIMPPGEAGELWIRGDSVTRFYWNKPEKTASSMREDGWFRSGDTVFQDTDGFFFFCGRDDDMLKVGGIWVAPFEVESALAAHPAVIEAAVVGAPDDAGLIKPKAYVVLRDPSQAGPALESELRAFVRTRLAPFKYPRWIEFPPELPKTASGKIQRFRLR
jgi:benzoate-CoA ligase family protein